ncbi:MAG: NADH-quinone oxidoreductase subunit L [Puniceicoccales bacterium]|jgi:NADH-quinone oxidoreductase subunit L|nr:NADH-quinone oxidoreductase subunit L [Puniceicoccales bacterium]
MPFPFSPEHLLWVLLLTPLAAAVLSAAFLRRSRWGAPVLSLAAAAVVLVASVALLFSLDAAAPLLRVSYPWLALGTFRADIGFLIDANAATLLFTVSFVAFWVQIHSVGQTRGDPARGRFFAGLSLFLFSILGLIVADNLYMVFVFWELVGFSTYLLLAHDFEKVAAVAASKKTFIVNRVGSLGFLVGIVLCQQFYGTVGIEALATAVGSGGADGGVAVKSTLVAALLVCGFVGKSAQFPLHVWLPEAMSGTTPVAALVHTAMMASAGVYFMVRVFFLLTPPVLCVLLWGCAAMAATAAFCALGQTDIKRSLAYSVLSQLGLMGAAIGLGLPEVALLHLTIHTFINAALFLCAGSVIQACGGEQDMVRMGGLQRRMPVTSVAFLLAGGSLCAFPGVVGWFSRDAILAGAMLRGEWGAVVLLAAAALGMALCVGRMWQLVFLGSGPHFETDSVRGWRKFWKFWRIMRTGRANSTAAAGATERNLWMSAPMIVLGIFAVGGSIALGGENASWLDGKMTGLFPSAATLPLHQVQGEIHSRLVELSAGAGAGTGAGMGMGAGMELMFVGVFFAVGFVVCLGGLLGAVWFYRKTVGGDTLRERFPRVYALLGRRWVDGVYDAWIAKVQQPFANMVGFFDTLLINGLAVRGVGAGIPGLLGLACRRLAQTGSLQWYLAWMVLGTAACAAVMLLW